MASHSLLGILSLGFTLGLFHALDADHIMAVSALSINNRKLKSRGRIISTTIGYCLKWALGHGSTLLAIGLLLWVSGYQLPGIVSEIAEKAIGVLLILLGSWIIWKVCKQQLHFHIHHHGDVAHMHLTDKADNQHSHQPVLVGVIHGMAGSAPVMALIPAFGSSGSSIGPWVGMSYLGLFSLGVLIAMVSFGLFFGQLQNWLSQCGNRIYQGSRILIGFSSILFGTYWLVS